MHNLPMEKIIGQYDEGKNTRQLGILYGVDPRTIGRRLNGAGVSMRFSCNQKGNTNARKAGGPLHCDAGGYYRSNDREGKHCQLHRACWEAYNGLIPIGYIIHHIDENRQNNDINNLMCMLVSEHIRFHRRKERDCDAAIRELQ